VLALNHPGFIEPELATSIEKVPTDPEDAAVL
jgi:hypothetical protein